MTSFISNDSLIVNKYSVSANQLTSEPTLAITTRNIFESKVPEALSENSASDTLQKAETTKPEYDTDELVKKYKKNPAAILDEIDFGFSSEQKEYLKNFLTDKKSLKSFLKIVTQSELSADDILAGIKVVAEKEGSKFFKKVGNVFKTLFKEGITEAFELAQSEQVYYSGKLGSNMNEIRAEREDFSSEAVANIGQAVTDEPEIKDSTMHFVEKDKTTGSKLYTESDVKNAVDIMLENPKEAEKFVDNAVELESIKDKNNFIKYEGSTIINVGQKMFEHEELKPTIIKTAQKTDMTDGYLVGISDNLLVNPEMQESLDKFLDLKDINGKDRFSAENILSQTDYMKALNDISLKKYTDDTLSISKYQKLDGNSIVKIAKNITDNPANKDRILEIINSNKYSKEELNSYINTNIDTEINIKNESNISQIQNNFLITNSIEKQNSYTAVSIAENEADNSIENSATIEINGTQYDKKAVAQVFYKKYGEIGDKILNKLESDPKFLETIKQYSDFPVILEAFTEKPNLVNKLLCSVAGLSKSEMSQIIPLCTNSENTSLMIDLISRYGVSKAVIMFTAAKNTHKLDEVGAYINQNTGDDNYTKKENIEKMIN